MEHESFEDAETAAYERALRQHQGRPRGAPRRRRHLHGGGAGDDRPGRLADDRLPRPRRASRSTAAPTSRPREPRHAGLPHGDGSGRRRLRAPARGDPRAGAADAARGSGAIGAVEPGGRSRSRRRLEEAVERLLQARRPRARRLRRRAQVPARLGARAAAGPRRDATSRRAHARRDDGRRHLRPARRRLRPLLGRRRLARPALREDALRQRPAGPRLPARLAGAGHERYRRVGEETLD